MGRQSHITAEKQERSYFPKGSLMEYSMRTENLRIEVTGWLVNEYQITESKLEFRALDGSGRPFPDQRSAWRRLTARELLMHFRLETAVAHWFLEKTAAWDSDAAQQELRKAA